MKKTFIAMMVAIGISYTSTACQICGCGLGNYYIGLLPQFNSKFIGLRYQYRSFHTSITGDPSQFSKDYFQAVELWAGWNIGKHWQLLAIVPFNTIYEVSDDGITDKNGLGDMAIMANYKVFEKRSESTQKNILQQFWIGAGIKLPTGTFNVDPTDPDLITLANTQMGSASTDFIMNAMYNIRINKLGFNTGASYKMNTDNKDLYKFGNKLSLSEIAFYSIPKSKMVITPNIGLSYENTAYNTLQSEKVAQTGGYNVMSSAGVELSFKKLTIGANAQLPVSQNFSEGQTETKFRGMMHVTFTL